MTCHRPDLSSASDWLKHIPLVARPNRSTTLICVVSRHQYGIPQTSFPGETCGGVAKCRLFSQAKNLRLAILKLQVTTGKCVASNFTFGLFQKRYRYFYLAVTWFRQKTVP